MYGLIGEKLSHSFSKEIHQNLFGYEYNLIEVAREKLDEFMTNRNFKAVNVTIPYKQEVIKHLYFIDELAQKIGAVNTVVNCQGKLYGYNTDAFGLLENLKANEIDVKDKTVLILGSGGTSLTAKAVCESLSAKEIYRTSREKKDGCVNLNDVDFNEIEVIINTTPVGMYPNVNDTPVDLDNFQKLEAVVDAVYNPINTLLVTKAREKNLKYAGGLYMLVCQAVKAGEYFTGKKVSEEKAVEIYKKILKEKQNIVLIGMPSSGKSTFGKILSKDLARPLFDTDKMIAQKAGKPIPEIFSQSGEKVFRDLETEVIFALSKEQGKIISTGGGAVLRQENVEALKQNGFLVFIDRPLENLTPTCDRPLSSDLDALKKRFEERYPIYNKVCDSKIKNEGNVNEVATLIKEAFLK